MKNIVRMNMAANFDLSFELEDRFAEVSDGDLSDLLGGRHSKNTQNATQFSKRNFIDYMTMHNYLSKDTVPEDFLERIALSELDSILVKFYAALRNKKGQLYKSNSFMAIRHNLNRYFGSLRSDADIVHGESFKKSTEIFDAMMKKLKREGKGDIVHKPIISKEHQAQLNKYFLRA